MTEDEVIQMAREAGVRDSLEYDHMECNVDALKKLVEMAMEAERDKWMERAAILIRGEREACAKVCDVLSVHPEYASDITKLAAQAIRARGNT